MTADTLTAVSCDSVTFEHLVVLHSHWRPGGVRRVVELALPAVVQAASPALRKVTVLSGGKAGEGLNIAPLGIETISHIDPVFDYFTDAAEGVEEITGRIARVLEQVAGGGDPRRLLLWFHNPALAKNPLVCAGVTAFAAANGTALVMHHHDFWCAGRWERVETLRRCGYEHPWAAAPVLFADGTRCRHVAINLTDCRTIAPFFPGGVDYLPNPVERSLVVSRKCDASLQKWVQEKTGGRPLWVCPTRLLRRKNLLEAVLLARWLRPEAVFATTSGAFSADETGYARAVGQVAEESNGSVLVGLLDSPDAPAVAEVFPIAEAVLLPSLREGFGMGFVEAADAGVPVIARRLPHVDPDLEALGFTFPHRYGEVWIDRVLFDERAETKRRSLLIAKTRSGWQNFSQGPAADDWAADVEGLFHSHGGMVAFSRLTLEAQLEVLRHPSDVSWQLCMKGNPELAAIKGGRLQPTTWPVEQKASLQGYAAAFLHITQSMPAGQTSGDSTGAQLAIARAALDPSEFFPLLL